MKKVRSCFRGSWWPVGIVALGMLAPGFAYAAKEKLVSLAQEACEAQARAAFKKKAVEMELALIAGSLNDLEHASAREDLQASMRKESSDCAKGLTASRASAKEATSGAL